MAETDGAEGAENTRGMPYYERLKGNIRDTLSKKRRIEAQLGSIDEQIFNLESKYLEGTPNGNVVIGFDNYMKGGGGAGGAGGAAVRKKAAILEKERIFSRSSTSYLRDSSPDSLSQPSHAPTPSRDSNAPTPTSVTGNKAGGASLKRTKKSEKDDDDTDSKPPKRLKMTFARGEKE